MSASRPSSARLAATLSLFFACAAPPAPDPWTLWTLDALEARHDPAIVEPGAALALLQSPYPAVGNGTGVQRAGQRGLTVFPAFSEGKPAAYLTTEVWENFDEVWVQPLYVDRTRKNRPIFGVDSTTRFYSPYWQVFLYSHPGGKDFESTKDVLDANVALTPNTAKFCAITRDASLGAAIQAEDRNALGALVARRPLNGDEVGQPQNGTAYADGKLVHFIDLGNAQRFTFDPATLVVEETPLFAFAKGDGTPLELPKVGGTGPWRRPRCDGHGNNCSGISNDVPEFGSLWRIWTVLLPTDVKAPTVDVYVRVADDPLRKMVVGLGFAATPPFTEDANYSLRVALDGTSCFKQPDLTQCKWLDSQNAIEALVPEWRISKTGTLATCPLIEFNGRPVPFK